MVTIAARFNGPTHSGNGGYVSGLIAARLTEVTGASGPVTSTLRQPPPLDTALTWETADGEVRLLTAGGAVVGEAVVGAFGREPITAPTAEQALAGQAAYPGHVGHPFSTCFTCGPDRDDGDGLRVFTGPVSAGGTAVAAPWVPHHGLLDPDGTLPEPVVWAAIDCAGGWTADFTKHPTVLGRMTAEVTRLPEIGEACTIAGRLDAHEGRKFLTSTALHAGDELIARSEQVWIEIDPSQF